MSRASRDAGDDDFADGDSGAVGEEEQVRAVLELLATGQRERRAGVLVPERPPDLREQPGVGRVTADDLDRDRATVGSPRDEARFSPHLLRAEVEIGDRDAEREEVVGDLAQRWCRSGCADDEMQRGRDAPSERDARDDIVHETHDAEERAERADPQREEDEAPRRLQQVRRRDEQHGRRDPRA